MIILLDTNVVSELMRPVPDPRTLDWVRGYPARVLHLSAVTVAELRAGVALLPAGKRREAIASAVTDIIRLDFAGRILPFDTIAAEAYGAILADRHRSGRPIQAFDAQIAAIARSREACLATRNTRDFEGCGLDIVNPWTADPGRVLDLHR